MGKIITDSTLNNVAAQITLSNDFLPELYGNVENLLTENKSNLVASINNLYTIISKRKPLLKLKYNHNNSNEYIECTYEGDGVLSASSSDTSIVDVEVDNNIVNIVRHKAGTPTITVNVLETDTYFSDEARITIPKGLRFGYRIKESESDPYVRVEYLYDAEGMTPAKMLTSGTFDYGSWRNIWFVKDNKPLMLNSDGTVAYYLNPNNYSLKEDGTASDIANTSFNGNAMAQMPLVWFKRYSENGYHYEIVSNVQYDDDYKAYAHTRVDGTIAPYFYYSMFGGSGSSSKLRSISGQSLVNNLTSAQCVTGAIVNGSNWYIHTWSQREYLRTLLVLMGKSTNSQAVYGNGNACNGSSASTLKTTGTLNDKGQFYGSLTANNVQVEKLWGDQHDKVAGLINNGKIYVKMTREGSGYQVDNVNGYTNTNIILSGSSGSYISQCSCNEYGMIPTVSSGTATTYYCDMTAFDNNNLSYLLSGGSAYETNSEAGVFVNIIIHAPSWSSWATGAGLSCEMPPTSS